MTEAPVEAPTVDDLLLQLRIAGAVVQVLSNRGGVVIQMSTTTGIHYHALGPTMLDALTEIIDKVSR